MLQNYLPIPLNKDLPTHTQTYMFYVYVCAIDVLVPFDFIFPIHVYGSYKHESVLEYKCKSEMLNETVNFSSLRHSTLNFAVVVDRHTHIR